MDPHQIKQHLTDLVLDGREEVAIEEMLAISHSSDDEIRNNITALSRRYQQFERDKSGGALSKQRINTTSDKISQALLVIIEQLTDEHESNHQMLDLESIFKEIDELSSNGSLLSKGRFGGLKKISVIVPICVILVVAFFVFNRRFGKTTNPGQAALETWVGVWHHEMQAAGDSKITGRLSFEMVDNDQFIGKASNLYPDGSETSNILSKIEFSNQGKVIEGIWQTDQVQSLRGTFRFSLENENQFDGYYTVINQDGHFYWKGTK